MLVLVTVVLARGSTNGFSIDDSALIPVDEIHSGGPPRDGIPSIDKPRFKTPLSVGNDVKPDDRVLGLAYKGITRAYPISIMNWHEIVNDRFGNEPVVITYCPLCGSGIAYNAKVAGKETHFGVSGLLYNSDVLLYDRQTESLWSQIMSKAVSGPLKGTRLDMLPLVHTSWSQWLADHPDTELLSRATGTSRDYDRDPYAGYENSEGIYFPVSKKDPRYHPKERILGVEVNGQYKAYPFSELSRTRGEIKDRFAGRDLVVRYDSGSESARIVNSAGDDIPTVPSFWFAWYAFHPETAVYTADN
ncbi:MAG: DUF3179 domain-containing protein [Gammaproteobacteria bacterium]|nr:DUF3179 domain-containing protein [Gammaproteobacteria bacterium]